MSPRAPSLIPDHLQPSADAADDRLLDAQGHSRALVLELRAPADVLALQRLWQGVQADLGWPAPAVAAGGSGLQLWCALADARPADELAAVGEALRQRYAPELPATRWQVWPHDGHHAAWPGAALDTPDPDGEPRWTAFVSPDLAPVFAETPWLDVAPGAEGQAALLPGRQPVSPAAWAAALPATEAPDPGEAQAAPAMDASAVQPAPLSAMSCDDPRAFLLQVMNDTRVPLALRIEAAKALLPSAPPSAGTA